MCIFSCRVLFLRQCRPFTRNKGADVHGERMLVLAAFNYFLPLKSENHTMLARLDEMMREGLERIINISLNKHQWMQASLPIRDGGLGLRRVSSLASSAYLASAACTVELQSAILTKCTTVPDAYFEEVLAARHDALPSV